MPLGRLQIRGTLMDRARLFGMACLIGGVLFAALNATEPLGIELSPGSAAVISVVLLIGLAGGPLGLLALGAAGAGRIGRVGVAGASVALIGLLSYLVG